MHGTVLQSSPGPAALGNGAARTALRSAQGLDVAVVNLRERVGAATPLKL